jgi:acetoin utilization deacetylase AcuC-like enzyme
VKAYYCDRFVLPLPPDHRFPMAKYRLLSERVLAERIVAPEDLLEPPLATREHLSLAHDLGYVDAVEAGTLPADVQRRIGFPWSPEMAARARCSVGATIAAARTALVEGTAANLAGGTHHAFRDRGEGYCVFNDVAVAARVLRSERPATRIAIVDCDVHQGNGTAAIFRDDPCVFTCSIHGEKNYPFRKEQSDLDVTLADGTGDEEYLAVLREVIHRTLDASGASFVFYVAGADPYSGDRLGRLSLSIDGLRRRDALVLSRCRAAGLPVAVAMGGGYAPDVNDIVTIHTNTLREASRWART